MTLKNKNKIFLLLFIFSMAILLIHLSVFVFAVAKNAVIPPENPIRTFVLVPLGSLCQYSFPASLVSIIAFLIASPVLSIVVFREFQKTASLEILFFSGFIIGCITESGRIIVPLFGLWKTNSIFLIAVGRSVIAGRFLSLMSLFFAAVFSSSDELQNAERNILILLVSTCLFGIFYPMDTTFTTSTCSVLWGYRTFFSIIRILLVLVTVFSVLADAYTREVSRIYIKALGVFILSLGYLLLCVSDCWFEFFLSIIFSILGCVLYLRTVHYLSDVWN